MNTEKPSETNVGWGYFLAIIDRAIAAKNDGRGVSLADDKNFTLYPREIMPQLMRQAMALHAITPEINEEIGAALCMVDPKSKHGTRKDPLTVYDQGEVMLARMHYDPNRVPVSQAAEELGVSVQAVYKMLKEGRLSGLKVGGRMGVFRSSLDSKLRRAGDGL